ncbi:TPA: response regulator transcription factor [Bacillus cereus]|nr:response regulator transcription factor [Bacillus cereus]
MYRILIVEDDYKIAELLRSHIEKYKYQGTTIKDFDAILDVFQEFQPHLILLDVNLPSFDGYYWCRQIRAISTCPIIFISARCGEMDQVMALENGADDYITKPFYYEVVMAKVRSNLRRTYGDYAPKIEERTVERSGLVLYPERLELTLRGRMVSLTQKESALLGILLERHPCVVTREAILDRIWEDYTYVDDNTLSVQITRTRKKLAELGIQNALESIRGRGYKLYITWDDGGYE